MEEEDISTELRISPVSQELDSGGQYNSSEQSRVVEKSVADHAQMVIAAQAAVEDGLGPMPFPSDTGSESGSGAMGTSSSTQADEAPQLRRGKWTQEEENFADRLMLEFKAGYLPLAEGTTLRTFLAKVLNCDPMRISKKFVGTKSIGKQIFKRSPEADSLSEEQLLQTRIDLAELERIFLEKESQLAQSKNYQQSLEELHHKLEKGDTFNADTFTVPPSPSKKAAHARHNFDGSEAPTPTTQHPATFNFSKYSDVFVIGASPALRKPRTSSIGSAVSTGSAGGKGRGKSTSRRRAGSLGTPNRSRKAAAEKLGLKIPDSRCSAGSGSCSGDGGFRSSLQSMSYEHPLRPSVNEDVGAFSNNHTEGFHPTRRFTFSEGTVSRDLAGMPSFFGNLNSSRSSSCSAATGQFPFLPVGHVQQHVSGYSSGEFGLSQVSSNGNMQTGSDYYQLHGQPHFLQSQRQQSSGWLSTSSGMELIYQGDPFTTDLSPRPTPKGERRSGFGLVSSGTTVPANTREVATSGSSRQSINSSKDGQLSTGNGQLSIGNGQLSQRTETYRAVGEDEDDDIDGMLKGQVPSSESMANFGSYFSGEFPWERSLSNSQDLTSREPIQAAHQMEMSQIHGSEPVGSAAGAGIAICSGDQHDQGLMSPARPVNWSDPMGDGPRYFTQPGQDDGHTQHIMQPPSPLESMVRSTAAQQYRLSYEQYMQTLAGTSAVAPIMACSSGSSNKPTSSSTLSSHPNGSPAVFAGLPQYQYGDSNTAAAAAPPQHSYVHAHTHAHDQSSPSSATQIDPSTAPSRPEIKRNSSFENIWMLMDLDPSENGADVSKPTVL